MIEPDEWARRNRRFTSILGVSALILAMGFSIFSMRQTFGGSWEREPWLGRNGARYSLIARNYQRIGWMETRCVPVISAGHPDAVPRQYYLHHPPLMPISLGLAFGLFGETEDVARGMMAGFTLLVIVFLFALVSSLYGVLAGGGSALVFALFPMTGCYGTHVDVQGSQVLALILLTMLTFRLYVKTSKSLWWIGSFVVFTLGLYSDWPAYYLGLLLPCLALFIGTKGLFKRSLVYPILCCVMFVVIKIQWGLVDAASEGFAESVEVRTLAFYREFAQWSPELRDAFHRWLPQCLLLYPIPMLCLCTYGVVSSVRRVSVSWVWALLSVGIIHVALFPAGALVHDYWLFALQPGLAAFGGLGLLSLVRMACRCHRRWGPVIGFSLVIALLGIGLVVNQKRVDSRVGKGAAFARLHRPLGEMLGQHSSHSSLIWTNAPYNPYQGQSLTFPQFSYYSDRRILGGIDTLLEWESVRNKESDSMFLWVPPHFFVGQIDDRGAEELIVSLRRSKKEFALGGGVFLFK